MNNNASRIVISIFLLLFTSISAFGSQLLFGCRSKLLKAIKHDDGDKISTMLGSEACSEEEISKPFKTENFGFFTKCPSETFLTYALKNDYFLASQAIIETGKLVQTPNEASETPIEIAFKKDRLDLVKSLVSQKIPIESEKEWYSELIHYAFFHGDTDLISHLPLKLPEDLNLIDEDGNTPIMTAYLNHRTDVVHENLRKGVMFEHRNKEGQSLFSMSLDRHDKIAYKKMLPDIKLNERYIFTSITDKNFITPFFYAIESGDTEMIDTFSKHPTMDFYEKNTSVDQSYLNKAAQLGKMGILDILFENDVAVDDPDQEGNTALILAAKAGHLEVCRTLLSGGAEIDFKNRENHSALYYAVNSNRLPIVKLLLNHRANTLRENYLVHPVLKKDYEMVEILLKHEADPNLKAPYPNYVLKKFNEDSTPLFHSMINEDLRMAELIMKFSQTDTSTMHHQGTLSYLNLAAQMSQLSIITKLLEFTKDLEDKDGNGNTPLLNAASRKSLDIVKILINAGAFLDATNKFDEDVFTLSKKNSRIHNYLIYLKRTKEGQFSNLEDLFSKSDTEEKLTELFNCLDELDRMTSHFLLEDHLIKLINSISHEELLDSLEEHLDSYPLAKKREAEGLKLQRKIVLKKKSEVKKKPRKT